MHSPKIGEKGNTKSILLLFLVFSTVLVPALRSPIPTPVIVVLSGEKRVTYTSNKIDAMLPRAVEVREGHLLTPWILMRARGGVIYVGHGTQRGIQIGSELVEWTDFAEQVRRTPSRRVYVASCYSHKVEQVVEATSKKQVVGFKGLVDVDEAAYSIAASIMHARGEHTAARNLLYTLVEVMFGKLLTPEKYHLWTLYLIDDGGGGGGSYSGDETKKIRGIWHIKHYESHYGDRHFVDYTHPDCYHHYYMGVNEDWSTGDPESLAVGHIGKDQQWTLEFLSYTLGGLLGGITGLAIGGGWGFVAGFILGVVWEYVTHNRAEKAKDENGESWLWIKDLEWKPNWNTWVRFDIKLGGIMWFFYAHHYTYFYSYPLWYGSDPELGLTGW